MSMVLSSVMPLSSLSVVEVMVSLDVWPVPAMPTSVAEEVIFKSCAASTALS